MRHELKNGPDFASLHVTFEAPGEELRTESGAMVARDTDVAMTTSLQGGLGAALTTEGLEHQRRAHDARIGMLYTDAANTAALALYGSLGFEAVRTDEAWTGSIG